MQLASDWRVIHLLLMNLGYTQRMRTHRHPHRFSAAAVMRGFSLIELSVVIAILSVVATLGLEAAANFINRSAGTQTRERLKVVDEAIASYFKIYGRLPCPAPIGTALANNATAFGIEDCTINVWVVDTEYDVLYGGGLQAGMVPIRTLNLPLSYATDGFGNKLNYVVTKNLTAAGGTVSNSPITNRFASFDADDNTDTEKATNGMGGIEIRTGQLQEPCSTTCQILANPSITPPTGAAYIVFSNGTDQKGGVPLRSTSASVACADSTLRVDSMNCQWCATANSTSVATIPKNVFYDNRYNAGLNLKNYFDDFVIWRSKAQL